MENQGFSVKSTVSRLNIYQYMAAFLILLILASSFFYGFGAKPLLHVLIAVLATTILDFGISYFRHKAVEFPQSALISGLFIGGILPQGLPSYIYIAAGAFAVLSKHLIRLGQKHIFNPANLGILLATLIFPAASDIWWITSSVLLVIIFGIFVLWRQRRFDLAASFVFTYFIANLAISPLLAPQFMGHNMMNDMPMRMMDYHNYYPSIINGGVIYFFAMFMLIEPKTHPRKHRITYGIIAAILLVILQNLVAYGITLALAIGNVLALVLDRISFGKKEHIHASRST